VRFLENHYKLLKRFETAKNALSLFSDSQRPKIHRPYSSFMLDTI